MKEATDLGRSPGPRCENAPGGYQGKDICSHSFCALGKAGRQGRTAEELGTGGSQGKEDETHRFCALTEGEDKRGGDGEAQRKGPKS